ncbi:MAG: hypothetical protein M1812_000679 [Candelaria pacifica]|nr:MAG: hypothetical protein M1812_000679 [Candelaria pacifica]
MEQVIPPNTGFDAQSDPSQYRLYPYEVFDDWEVEYTGPGYAEMEDEQGFEEGADYEEDLDIEEDPDYSITAKPRSMEPYRAEALLSTENLTYPKEYQSESDGYRLEPKVYDNSGDLYFLKPDRYHPESEENGEFDEGWACDDKAYEFDADECVEYLIYDVGQELARNFRYSDGIDELYNRLMCRYGDKNISKAIAVFRSLLENDDACGLGDDGDCFRCWRHEYKYRGEDLSNPGTPRFPGIILPPAPPKQRKKGSSSQASPESDTFEDGYHTLRPLRFTAVAGPRSPSDFPIVGPPEAAWFSRTQSDSLNPKSSLPPVKPSIKGRGVAFARQKIRSHCGTVRNMVPRRLTNPFKKSKQEVHDTHNTHNTQDMQSSEPKVPFDAEHTVAYSSRLPPFHFGFDGAADEEDNEYQSKSIEKAHGGLLSISSKLQSSIDESSDEFNNGNTSFVDLNRALPSVPSNALQNTELTNRTSYSEKGSNSSTAVSSGHHSHSSSKHHFRNLTRELLTPAYLELSVSSHQRFGELDPNKFSPPPSRERKNNMKDTYEQYRLTNGNPFSNERQTQWPSVNDEQFSWQTNDNSTAFQGHYISEPKGMSHSRSEGSIALMGGPTPIDTWRANKAYVHPAAIDRAQYGNISPTRGRSQSPIKFMDEIKEQGMAEAPPSDRKRSRSPVKKMFGENGWLGKSISLKDLSNESPKKTGLKHWGGKLIQRVEGITEDVSKKLPHPFNPEPSSKQPVQSKFPVSLNPLAQAKLYSEVELMICATANSFLLNQKRHGLMSIESITKIVDHWKNRGRPQVIEFQFDQQTQRDLVLYNIKAFRFCGPQADDALAINSMMHSWRSVAKEMSVRTFCTPDSVIRKHMFDIYKILELLGAPEVTFLAFQDISVKTAIAMRDAQRRRDAQQPIKYGVERPWYPPVKEGAEVNGGLDAFFEG